MKKFILIVALLFSHSLFANINPFSNTELEAVRLSQTEKVIPKKIREENKKLHYSINVIYPQITGKKLSEGTVAFNQEINHIIQTELKEFKNRIKRDLPHMQTLPVSAQHNSFRVDYDLDVIPSAGLVSVRLTLENFQAGRAHPHRSHRVLNFDLVNHKALALSDLFKSQASYLEILAKYSQDKLQNHINEKDKWMIDEGTKPLAKNFKNWNIDADSILITFDEYQVAPYVYGAQEVDIPLSELRNVLSSQGQLIASGQKPPKYLG